MLIFVHNLLIFYAIQMWNMTTKLNLAITNTFPIRINVIAVVS